LKLIFATTVIFCSVSLPAGAQFAATASPAIEQQPLQASDTAQLDALLTAAHPVFTFRADDVITVHVTQILDYLTRQRVSDDGTIVFPLIGKVMVQGLTVQQLQSVIASKLEEGELVRHPQVVVVAESLPSIIVTVSGQVAKPGNFPAFGNLTLMDYLSAAGGILEIVPNGATAFDTTGSLLITLIRPGLPSPVVIPLNPNPASGRYGRIPIFPGDEIRVAKVGTVYAVGALKTQGAYPLKNSGQTTVMQLIALSGGIGYEADATDSRIVRSQGDAKVLIAVNVHKIMQGKAPDMALQSDDILFIPTNQLKAAIKGGGSNLVVSLASAYLYASR
jgi:polysaccharide export outer membrane protein